MTKQRILSLALIFIPSTSLAQLSLVPDQELIKLSGAVTQRTGDDVRGTITAAIESGWHINSVKPLDGFVIPTTLAFDGADLLKADFPPHELKDFPFSGGKKLAVYAGRDSVPSGAGLEAGDAG